MNKSLSILSLGVFVAFSRDVVAEDPQSASDDLPIASVRSVSLHAPPTVEPEEKSLCATVCSPSEACVDGRCIEACDPDCREGTICTEFGTCVPVPLPTVPRWTEAEVQERHGSESAGKTSVLLIEPLGVAFQGIQLGYEWGAKNSFIVQARLMNTGFMSYANEPLTEFERFDYGYGLSLTRRFYEGRYGNMRGFYYGFGVEVQAIAVALPYDAVRGTFKVAALGHFGYRWAWEGVTFGFGPVVGVRTPVYSAYISEGDDACGKVPCPLDERARLEGQLSLELGFFP